jgi:hypothetical protein
MVETAVLGMTFKEEADQEKIQDAISKFYFDNREIVDGAWYYQFRNEETLDRVQSAVNEIGVKK